MVDKLIGPAAGRLGFHRFAFELLGKLGDGAEVGLELGEDFFHTGNVVELVISENGREGAPQSDLRGV